MPTNRKVIDFKIHNLTEEQFQELKETGQIDPNAIYCTPDETVVNFEKINKEIEALKYKGGIPLLTPIWADHTLNDISWLNADTFSWQSGDVYVAAYEHLLEDYENRIGKGTESDGWLTETIDGVLIYYVVAPDGHKICVSDNETNVQAIYEKTGVAWYYILDTANKQFKLPRTKFGFTGLRDSVGGYVKAGLPNITGEIYTGGTYGFSVFTSANGAFKSGAHSDWRASTQMQNISGATENVYIDASRSSSVYGNSNTVQPKATQMYLYFYVGNFERDAVEQTAGITSEMFNNKADLEIFNAIYPVGSIYIGTQATCPMAIAIKGSIWELLEAGRALWTGNGSNGNTTVAAGLPNITATFAHYTPNVGDMPVSMTSGAAYGTRQASVKTYSAQIIDSGSGNTQIAIDASRSSSVYGNSDTVQPPAYVVNVWRRTA